MMSEQSCLESRWYYDGSEKLPKKYRFPKVSKPNTVSGNMALVSLLAFKIMNGQAD